uniref:GOLD domain-containing protein n=1 Tax=Ditylenchus dipsaci TaxID=166011 RepID=A0A915ERN6_9BILA
MKNILLFVFTWSSLLFLHCIRAGEYDLTVEIPPGKFQCFFQTVAEKHKSLEIDYQVIDGGDLNVNFMLIFGANILKQDDMKTDGSHSLFSGSMWNSQEITKSALTTHSATRRGKSSSSKFICMMPGKRMEELGMTVTQFHDSFGRIKSLLSKIEYYQAMQRSQENRDRVIMNANHDRVLLWSIINSVVLISVGAVQVFMIRSLFEENSKMAEEVFTTTGQAFNQPSQQEEIVMAVVVEPGKIECMYQTISNEKYTSFEIDYQVIEGGENDITFMIKSPTGVIIAHELKSTDGTHKIELEKPNHGRGDYSFCFDNSFSVTSTKRVFFELFLLDKDGNYLNDYDLKALAKDHKYGMDFQIENFSKVTNKVKGNLNEIERLQSQLRAIEARDRSVMEANYDRVNFWSGVHLVCLLIVTAVQIYTLRSLFLEDSKYGQFIRKVSSKS